MKLMKWFYDLKIGAKLVAGFTIILALVIFVTVIENKTITILSRYAQSISTQRLPGLQSLHTIKEAQMAITLSEWNLAQKNYSKAQRLQEYEAIESSLKQAEEARKQYRAPSKEAAEIWRKFNSEWAVWKKNTSQFIELSKEADLKNTANMTGTFYSWCDDFFSLKYNIFRLTK
jgi:hypothetical protein